MTTSNAPLLAANGPSTAAGRLVRLVVCLLAVAGGASYASAQEDQPPTHEQRAPREGRPERAGTPDAASLRERLESRLNEVQEQRRQLRAALERLEQGASPGDVFREFGPFLRGQGRGEGPGRGEGQDRPPPPDGMRERDEGRQGPGMRGDGRGQRPAQRQAPISAEERERLMAQLREHAPDLAARVEAMQSRDPETARRFGARLLPRVHEAMRLRESEPDTFRLKIRELTNSASVFEAMRAFRDAPEAEPAVRAEREGALRQALGEQFAIRREILARDIDALSKRLDGMRAELEKGEADKQDTIDMVIKSVKEFHDAMDREQPPPPAPPAPR